MADLREQEAASSASPAVLPSATMVASGFRMARTRLGQGPAQLAGAARAC
jgi:hypothetical protein